MSEPLKKSSKSGIVFGCIVVALVAGLLTIVFPSFREARAIDTASVCVNNLRQFDAAANQFALEHSKTKGDAIRFPDDLTAYIKLNSAGKIPPCPGGGIYHISKVGEAPTCTLSTFTPAHKLP